MNFLSLEYFITVAECGSIREAAKQLYITEQSLSERIKKLEGEVGAKLINRTRPHTLTPEGQFFLTGAKEILAVYAKTQAQIARVQAVHPEQTVRIWASSSIGVPSFLPDLVTNFHQKHPNYRAEIVMTPDDRDLTRADLYFLPLFDDRPMEKVVLSTDTICVMVSDTLLKQVFGGEKEAVCRQMEQGDLSPLFRWIPFLEPADEAQSHLSPEDLTDQPNRIVLSDNRALDFTLCVKGNGALVGPEKDFRSKLQRETPADAAQMHLYPIPDHPPVQIAISFAPGHVCSSAEQAFIAVAKTCFSP